MSRWNEIIGLKGIDSAENSRAKFCSQILEWPMLAATLWVISIWYLSSRSPLYDLKPIHDYALWSLFIFETTILAALVDDTKRYLRSNWINIIIILMGIPILWGATSYGFALRALRLLTLFSLLVHVVTSLEKLLSQNSLGPVVLSSLIVIIMAGFMVATLDPGIESASDGIWWAWVTVTTVGYGDVVPTSPIGRIFGGVLILIGLGLFAALTASFTSLFISKVEKEEQAQLRRAIRKVNEISTRLEKIEAKLDSIISTDTEKTKTDD